MSFSGSWQAAKVIPNFIKFCCCCNIEVVAAEGRCCFSAFPALLYSRTVTGGFVFSFHPCLPLPRAGDEL